MTVYAPSALPKWRRYIIFSGIARQCKPSYPKQYILSDLTLGQHTKQTKKSWFFPNGNDCDDIQIIIYTVAKIVIYSARQQNRYPTLQQFLNNLKFETDKELNSARRSNTIDQYNKKWKQLKSLPILNIHEIAQQPRRPLNVNHT